MQAFRKEPEAVVAGAAPAVCPADFPLVGVGACEGGLEAFSSLLSVLPPDPGFAIVLLQQRLDPLRTKVLPELLRRSTALRVEDAVEGLRVQPDTVYVVPPKTPMTIEGGVFLPAPRPGGGWQPIDGFFRSLAQAYGQRAIGVILSGDAGDGALGLQAIQARGGATLAQDETAAFTAMPRNAITAGCVDVVCPPSRMAAELVRLSRRLLPLERQPAISPGELAEISALMMRTHGLDLSNYDAEHVCRRIQRRMALGQVESAPSYCEDLQTDSFEREALSEDLLSRPLGFFRDSAALEDLKTKVYPKLFEGRHPETRLRIWVPACGRGEEVYSVAITLLEFQERAGVSTPVQIFGTDLSHTALQICRAGIYPEAIACTLSEARRERFFMKTHDGYRVAPSVRNVCLFARHNLAADPPFSRVDLLVSRDALRFFDSVAQTRVLHSFYYALAPQGVLLLGNSDGVPNTELFIPAKSQRQAYLRRHLPSPPGAAPLRSSEPAESNAELERRALQSIVGRYGPACFLVDRHLHVLGAYGPRSETGLPRMANGSLGLELRMLVDKARRRRATVHGDALRLTDPDRLRAAPVVVPIESAGREYYLILLEQESGEAQPHKPQSAQRASAYTRKLERSLTAMTRDLEQTVAEQQSAIEELRAANEEIAASNEELLAINGELLTAKGEVQSANHELEMVNGELAARNRELIELNNHWHNLLRNLAIPLLIVDRNLRIRRFTAPLQCLLKLDAAALGRHIGEFKPRFALPDLEKLLRNSVDNLAVFEQEVRDPAKRAHWLSIQPYFNEQNAVDGAILTLSLLPEPDDPGLQAPSGERPQGSLIRHAGARRSG